MLTAMPNREHLSERAQRLTSARSAYVAAYTDRRLLNQEAIVPEALESNFSNCLTFEEFRLFARDVWADACASGPLWITKVEALPEGLQIREFKDAAASARWDFPLADRIGVPRKGELAGTKGPVAYIDVKDEGLSRLVALHEIAHLLCDSMDVHAGHGERWAETYRRLISKHLGETWALVWEVEFEWWTEKAAAKIATDPDWLADMIHR